jgi:FkbM family methyltransferase
MLKQTTANWNHVNMIKPITLNNGATAHVIDGDTHISRWVEESGRLDHDQNMLPLTLPYLTGTVIDVGAFIGDHTVFYAQHGPSVLAFEPSQEAFTCLCRNIEELNNVRAFRVGLGASPGNAAVIQNANAGMAALVDGGDVPIVTLDSLNLSDVSFIKIDAEGWECDVLEGARETIARCRPAMLIEVNDSALRARGRKPGELIVKIEGMRYRMRNIYHDQPMQGPQYDALCLPLA